MLSRDMHMTWCIHTYVTTSHMQWPQRTSSEHKFIYTKLHAVQSPRHQTDTTHKQNCIDGGTGATVYTNEALYAVRAPNSHQMPNSFNNLAANVPDPSMALAILAAASLACASASCRCFAASSAFLRFSASTRSRFCRSSSACRWSSATSCSRLSFAACCAAFSAAMRAAAVSRFSRSSAAALASASARCAARAGVQVLAFGRLGLEAGLGLGCGASFELVSA